MGNLFITKNESDSSIDATIYDFCPNKRNNERLKFLQADTKATPKEPISPPTIWMLKRFCEIML